MEKFNLIPLRIVSKVISFFISKEQNEEKAHSYILNEFKYTISKNKIYQIYSVIRNIIDNYLKFEYQLSSLADENEKGYFSIDESLIAHKNGKQIWLLGIIYNSTKDFRMEGTYERATDCIQKFICCNLKKGNNIITDGFVSYNFLDRINSGYTHIKHIHGGGNFGFGCESTSHIESIWSQLKEKKKKNILYYTWKIILHFVREAEFKLKLKAKSGSEKIREFFSCYKFLNDVQNVLKEDNGFLTYSFNDSFSDH